MPADLVLPESLLAYLGDQGVRSAVATLHDHEDEDFLLDLEARDLPDYYRARLAMRHLLAEWGIFGHRFWRATWGEALAAETTWQPLTLAELMEDEANWSVTEDTLRVENDFEAGWANWVHEDRCFYSRIILAPDGAVSIAIDIDTFGKERLAALHLPTCRFEHDKERKVFRSDPLGRIVGGEIPVAQVRDACVDAAAAMMAWVTAQPPRRARRTT